MAENKFKSESKEDDADENQKTYTKVMACPATSCALPRWMLSHFPRTYVKKPTRFVDHETGRYYYYDPRQKKTTVG